MAARQHEAAEHHAEHNNEANYGEHGKRALTEGHSADEALCINALNAPFRLPKRKPNARYWIALLDRSPPRRQRLAMATGSAAVMNTASAPVYARARAPGLFVASALRIQRLGGEISGITNREIPAFRQRC
jgi:hypothetical protein